MIFPHWPVFRTYIKIYRFVIPMVELSKFTVLLFYQAHTFSHLKIFFNLCMTHYDTDADRSSQLQFLRIENPFSGSQNVTWKFIKFRRFSTKTHQSRHSIVGGKRIFLTNPQLDLRHSNYHNVFVHTREEDAKVWWKRFHALMTMLSAVGDEGASQSFHLHRKIL